MIFYRSVKKNMWAKGLNITLSVVFIVWDIGWAMGYEDLSNAKPFQEQQPLVRPEDAKVQRKVRD